MAKFNVFNPVTGFSPTLGFNPNWNYGSPRQSANNFLMNMPRQGNWYSRLVGNGGYGFDLVFVDRPIQQVRYIRAFYQDYQQGFFTLVDYDNAARHHVGRFTAYTDDTETANLKYTVRVRFQEIPRSPMLAYPSSFANDGHALNVVDDSLSPLVAAMQGSWQPQVSPLSTTNLSTTVAGVNYLTPPSSQPSAWELIDLNPQQGDWAQTQYVGWGFSMTFRLDPSFGPCCVLLDGNALVTGLSLVDGSFTGFIFGGATAFAAGPSGAYPHGSVTVACMAVPLDIHRVKVIAGSGGSDGSGPGGTSSFAILPLLGSGASAGSVIFPALEYIF